jgi:hypothetical protein
VTGFTRCPSLEMAHNETWFVPLIVVPVFVVLMLVAYAAFRLFT